MSDIFGAIIEGHDPSEDDFWLMGEVVHGDYNSTSMDITDRDVIKIMLMWLNMRLISDHFCYIEEMIENRITLIPYLCTLPEDLAIDIMSIM